MQDMQVSESCTCRWLDRLVFHSTAGTEARRDKLWFLKDLMGEEMDGRMCGLCVVDKTCRKEVSTNCIDISKRPFITVLASGGGGVSCSRLELMQGGAGDAHFSTESGPLQKRVPRTRPPRTCPPSDGRIYSEQSQRRIQRLFS